MNYAQIYRRLLWPAYETFRGRHTLTYLQQVERNQWLPAPALAAQQWAALQQLLRHAYAQAPWYRARFDQAGLRPEQIRSLADYRRLPAITKDDIRQHRAAMVAENYRDRVYEHQTGGSSGTPLRFLMTRESYEWRNAAMARGYGWAGAHDGVKIFYLWGVPLNQPSQLQLLKAAAHDWVARRKLFNHYQLSPATMPDCLAQLNAFSPRVLVGYTSMLEQLARYIRTHGGLRVKLQSVVTAAEGIAEPQRQLIREIFGTPVFASYGCREFKLIAMECERGGLHLSADNLLVEIIKDNQPASPGELGRVLITDLHNYGMPFLRYEIGDLAVASTDVCPCGRGLPLLREVHGRLPDTVQTPEGKLITGVFFPQLFMWHPWVVEFQVHQPRLDGLQIKLVVTDRLTATAKLPELEARLRSILGLTIQLQFEFCNEIPRGAWGKHRIVVSDIPVNI